MFLLRFGWAFRTLSLVFSLVFRKLSINVTRVLIFSNLDGEDISRQSPTTTHFESLGYLALLQCFHVDDRRELLRRFRVGRSRRRNVWSLILRFLSTLRAATVYFGFLIQFAIPVYSSCNWGRSQPRSIYSWSSIIHKSVPWLSS